MPVFGIACFIAYNNRVFSVSVLFPEYLRYGFRASVAGGRGIHSGCVSCAGMYGLRRKRRIFIILKAWLLREIAYICRVLLALEARDGQGAVKRIYIKA